MGSLYDENCFNSSVNQEGEAHEGFPNYCGIRECGRNEEKKSIFPFQVIFILGSVTFENSPEN